MTFDELYHSWPKETKPRRILLEMSYMMDIMIKHPTESITKQDILDYSTIKDECDRRWKLK